MTTHLWNTAFTAESHRWSLRLDKFSDHRHCAIHKCEVSSQHTTEANTENTKEG